MFVQCTYIEQLYKKPKHLFILFYICCFPISEEGEGRPPITVKFEIPYFTTSGIQVRVLYRRGYSILICKLIYVLQSFLPLILFDTCIVWICPSHCVFNFWNSHSSLVCMAVVFINTAIIVGLHQEFIIY